MKSKATAVEKIAEALNSRGTSILVQRAPSGVGWSLWAFTEDDPLTKPTARALAFLADLALHHPDAEAIREEVDWTGSVPMEGLAGWEDGAMCWLRYGTQTVEMA